ncbi:MAG: lysostaphin resistance A-like protein, partial [Phenylobacterium sp.]
ANEPDPALDAKRALSDFPLTEPSARTMPYLEYSIRGRNALWRYVAGFIGALLLTVIIAVVVIGVLQVSHLFPADFAKNLQDASQPEKFYPANGVVFGLLLLGFVGAARMVHGKTFGDIIGAWRWPLFCQGMAIWIAVLLASTLIDFLIAPAGFKVTASAQTPKLAIVALGGLAIQTFAEEFIFRGYLTQGLLAATRRTIPTALISGALFGAMHIPNGLPQAVSATVFGVILAVIAIRTGGIAFTSGLHLANNAFGAIVLISSGDAFRGSPGILTQNTPQLMWWDTAVGAVGLVLVAVWVVWSRGTRPRTGAAGS